MKPHIPETRLDEIREQAALGHLDAKGIRPPGSPFPEETSYYGLPLVKPPVWTWEVPLYFFVGGAAGASSVLAFTAQLAGASPSLVRDARWIAAIGAAVSGPLLILDLGRPERFLNMLRVFKPQSPMSVGAWTLSVFGTATAAAVISETVHLPRIGDTAAFVAALSGLAMATYTGVLIGATAIPVWAKHARSLPIHFGASTLASATALLNLRGHDEPALNTLGLAAAAFETYTDIEIKARDDIESEPLRRGPTGITTRIGGFFSGPLPLVLRLLGIRSKRARRVAAASALLGSLITRMAWVEAGKASARDPRTSLR
jgi:Polysulphide reductase, NrfD